MSQIPSDQTPGANENAARRRASPPSEEAPEPHSDWGLAERAQGAWPLGADAQAEPSSEPARSDAQATADGGVTPHRSGTGADAEPYETGAASGDYEGDGFNRGYGVEPDPLSESRDGYLDARHGDFGDIEDKEDLYGEGQAGPPEK